MTNHLRLRFREVAIPLALLLAAPPAGVTSQLADKEKDDLIQVITTIVDVVIPAAAQEFETLKSYKIGLDLREVPSWHTKLRLPQSWESEIRDHGLSTELEVSFSSWPEKDGSWSKVGKGGAWLDSLYYVIHSVLSRELKNGWKRKSEKDRKVGEADYGTGDKTRWTRTDGLVVLIERNEDWKNEIYGSRISQRDINYISSVYLNIHVIKPK